jgi:hypothetical protein
MIMRRSQILLFLFVSIALLLPSPAVAQKKVKDPVLQTYLEEQFTILNKKLDEVVGRIANLEADMAKLKQQQADTATELHNAQTVMRNTDSSLTSFRLSNQQDVIALKTDVAKISQGISTLLEGIKKAETTAAAEAQKMEGYITVPPEEGKDTCTINRGTAAGVKVGMRFKVYKVGDPNTQVGLLEITEVMDANNSRAKVLQTKAGFKLEFSDVVRPE